MKIKKSVIIFILILLTLGSGVAIFFTKEKSGPVLSEIGEKNNLSSQLAPEKNEPALNEEPKIIEKSAVSAVLKQLASTSTSSTPKIIAETRTASAPSRDNLPVEEKVYVVMIINNLKYEAAVKEGDSVYDLMSLLKTEKKIDFNGKIYPGLGFFAEEINGVRNNPSGENWLYYVNGKPAQVGVTYYKLKNNNIIEWKYEKKSF